MKNKIRHLHWVIVFLAGCSSQPVTTALPAYQATTSPTITKPTVTPTPAPPKTATPETRFTRQCFPVDDGEYELDEITAGTILVSWRVPATPPPGGRLYAFKDTQTKNEYALPSESTKSSLHSIKFSPNLKMLAILESVYDSKNTERGPQVGSALSVFNAQAEVVAKMVFDRTDLVSSSWLDDERLLIYTEKYGHQLLVNPFTGEQQELADELPDLYPDFEPRLWWPIAYSPDLEWVTYYFARKENGKYRQGPVVYNLKTKQILWDQANQVGSDPAWSPDGQTLAFTGGMDGYKYQLYLFSHNGDVKAVLDESLPHEAFAFSWSPDSRYIAFWNDESLMVYDVLQDWVFDTCISGGQLGVLSSPSWSPNSRQIIALGFTTEPILVDWHEKRGYKIKDNGMSHYGWINSTP
jgi:hypothetical protein